jgi:hypothetical protein
MQTTNTNCTKKTPRSVVRIAGWLAIGLALAALAGCPNIFTVLGGSGSGGSGGGGGGGGGGTPAPPPRSPAAAHTATSPEDIADFGAGADVEEELIVRNSNAASDVYSWLHAKSVIRNGGDGKNYLITIEGAVTGIAVDFSANSTFGDVTGLTVSIRGSRSDSLSPSDNIILIELISNQILTLRGPSLMGHSRAGAALEGAALVYIDNGEFRLVDGSIRDNFSAMNGGGVFVTNGGTFTMSGGAISGNTTPTNGSGVWVEDGTFTMSGGEIWGNTSTDRYYCCGWVGVENGTFTMSGGEIRDNTAYSGGGVFIINGTFTMIGGKIWGNTSNKGGGVYFIQTATFEKTGGVIYGKNEGANTNTASADTMGYAVYAFHNTTPKYRDTTADTGDNLSAVSGTFTGGWSP